MNELAFPRQSFICVSDCRYNELAAGCLAGEQDLIGQTSRDPEVHWIAWIAFQADVCHSVGPFVAEIL